MFVDASALIAMIVPEDDGEVLMLQLERAERRYASPIVIYEAVLGIRRIFTISVGQAWHLLSQFIRRVDIFIVEIDADAHSAALLAFERYGKGTKHPAQLNMGDCFSYSLARSLGVPLLYKGNDFAKTDLA